MGERVKDERPEKTLMIELFHSFGKSRVNEDICRAYMRWADRQGLEVAKVIVQRAIDEEDRLPPIAQLNRMARDFKRHVPREQEPDIDPCWYCDDDGVVPILFKASDRSGNLPYIRMAACKCTAGDRQALPDSETGIRMSRYFDRFVQAQFEDRVNDFLYMNYPQIVDQVKFEKLDEARKATE